MENRLLSNFKKELPCFTFKFLTELVICSLIGATPVYFNSSSNQELEETVQGLLAITQLMNHAFYLLIPYTIICLYKIFYNRKTESGAKRFNYIHKIATEVGTNFLGIIRAGFGAIFGYFLVSAFTEVGAQSPEELLSSAIYSLFTLILCAGLSLFHDLLSPPLGNRYKNHLKFDRNLK